MTDADDQARLEQLLSHANRFSHQGQLLVVREDESSPAVGIFLSKPNRWGRPPLILLLPDRTATKKLFTLCHELGHCCSWIRGNHSNEYDQAAFRLSGWRSDLGFRIRGYPEAQALPAGARIPDELYRSLRARAESEKPNPLSAQQKDLVLQEEIRAWCTGARIARAFGASREVFEAEATSAVRVYFQDLGLEEVSWFESRCGDPSSAADDDFVSAFSERKGG